MKRQVIVGGVERRDGPATDPLQRTGIDDSFAVDHFVPRCVGKPMENVLDFEVDGRSGKAVFVTVEKRKAFTTQLDHCACLPWNRNTDVVEIPRQPPGPVVHIAPYERARPVNQFTYNTISTEPWPVHLRRMFGRLIRNDPTQNTASTVRFSQGGSWPSSRKPACSVSAP